MLNTIANQPPPHRPGRAAGRSRCEHDARPGPGHPLADGASCASAPERRRGGAGPAGRDAGHPTEPRARREPTGPRAGHRARPVIGAKPPHRHDVAGPARRGPGPVGLAAAAGGGSPATPAIPTAPLARPATGRTASAKPSQKPSGRPSPTATGGGSATADPSSGATSGGADGSRLTGRLVRDYYELLPEDTDAAWDLLAPELQDTIGRGTFEGFWATIDEVRRGRRPRRSATTWSGDADLHHRRAAASRRRDSWPWSGSAAACSSARTSVRSERRSGLGERLPGA